MALYESWSTRKLHKNRHFRTDSCKYITVEYSNIELATIKYVSQMKSHIFILRSSCGLYQSKMLYACVKNSCRGNVL